MGAKFEVFLAEQLQDPEVKAAYAQAQARTPIVEIFEAHTWEGTGVGSGPRCSCGASGYNDHDEHVADAILASDWLAECDRRTRAEAWERGWNAAVNAPPYALYQRPMPCITKHCGPGDLCCCPRCEGVPNPYA